MCYLHVCTIHVILVVFVHVGSEMYEVKGTVSSESSVSVSVCCSGNPLSLSKHLALTFVYTVSKRCVPLVCMIA